MWVILAEKDGKEDVYETGFIDVVGMGSDSRYFSENTQYEAALWLVKGGQGTGGVFYVGPSPEPCSCSGCSRGVSR